MENQTSVLIIGAGAAGLTAAADLSAAGVEVVLIEARDRVGGRIHTHHQISPATQKARVIPVELGAEFVHGQHPQLMQIIKAAGAPFCDVTDRHWYFENGVSGNSQDFWNKLTALMELMNPSQPDRSFKDFLDSLPHDDATIRARALATRYVQGFHAADINRIGVHGLIEANKAEDEIDGNHSFRMLDGYDVVTETLREQAQTRGALIHLNTIVKELRWNRNQVEAVCIADKRLQKFSGSQAVVTLPLGVLQARQHQRGAVRFVPELPLATRAAIENLAMGPAVRITLEFRERFWETLDLTGSKHPGDPVQLGFIHYPEVPIPTWWTLLPLRTPLLVGWVGGPNAEKFAGQNQEYLVGQALSSLKQIFGVAKDRLHQLLANYYTHDWSADPFSRGAYAYLPVNGLEAQRTLAQACEDTLYFAGEATSVGHVGTVHGAIESGRRAAKGILAHVSG